MREEFVETGLIAGMISKKGRPFSTFLVCNPGGKRLLSWEFPPREPKPKAAPKKKAARDKFGKQAADEA